MRMTITRTGAIQLSMDMSVRHMLEDSQATNRNALSDAYVKFFRWAVDRLERRDGIVCFVSNNSFIEQIAFDGMRKHLLQDFTQIYHLDLMAMYVRTQSSLAQHTTFLAFK